MSVCVCVVFCLLLVVVVVVFCCFGTLAASFVSVLFFILNYIYIKFKKKKKIKSLVCSHRLRDGTLGRVVALFSDVRG